MSSNRRSQRRASPFSEEEIRILEGFKDLHARQGDEALKKFVEFDASGRICKVLYSFEMQQVVVDPKLENLKRNFGRSAG